MKRLALAAVLVLALALPVVAADHPLLVTPAWLAERLGRADVRIVDLSDAEDYARGHIPGAMHLDVAETRAQASEGVFRVPTAEEGRRLMTQLRITPETTVVLYDDEGSLQAAWLFLVLDVLGHSRVSVLDGGAQRWRAGGVAWTTTVPPPPASSSVSTPYRRADRLAGAAWVRDRLARRDGTLALPRREVRSHTARARRGVYGMSVGLACGWAAWLLFVPHSHTAPVSLLPLAVIGASGAASPLPPVLGPYVARPPPLGPLFR